VVAGWYRRHAGSRCIEGSFEGGPGKAGAGQTIIREEIVPGTPMPAEILSGITGPADLRLAVVR
jgi:hypothetical protein